MDGDRRDADFFEPLEQRQDVIALPPLAHFHRQRDLHALANFLDDAGGAIEVLEQRRTGAAVDDLADRTAHVDVDDVDAFRFDDGGRVVHAVGIATIDLNRDRPLGLGVRQHLLRSRIVAGESLGRNEFGHDESRAAELLDQRPVVGVRHLGHRRKGQRRIDTDIADGKRLHGCG